MKNIKDSVFLFNVSYRRFVFFLSVGVEKWKSTMKLNNITAATTVALLQYAWIKILKLRTIYGHPKHTATQDAQAEI